jgi:hypothetical protein
MAKFDVNIYNEYEEDKRKMTSLFMSGASSTLKEKLTVLDMEEVIRLMVDAHYFSSEDTQNEGVVIKGFEQGE